MEPDKSGRLEGLAWRLSSSCPPLLDVMEGVEDAWEPNESCDNSCGGGKRC